MKNPALYVVTFYDFNHRERGIALDDRFLKTDKNVIFYLIDPEVPEVLRSKKCLLEAQVDPTLAYPGRLYLAEWTFLLAEYRHRFCEYPFFTTSSRFYEKNNTLRTDLNLEWDRLFSFFDKYDWGWLPSYDRASPFVDTRSPSVPITTYFTADGVSLLSDLFGPHVHNSLETPYSGDFYCNYLGFKDRNAFEKYVEYYLPVIDRFFTPDWMPRENIQKYLVKDSTYRNFKPFTLLLEVGSHQFFFDTRAPYFAMNYDGYYEIHENSQSFARIGNLSTSEPVQTRELNNRSIQVTSCPLRACKHWAADLTEPRKVAKLAPDPILSFKLRELFEKPYLYLDLDSGRGIPMLDYSLDVKRTLCVDGADHTDGSVMADVWQKHASQAVNADAYGHLRITDKDSGAPVLFDLVTTFNIPELPQHLYGNLARNILTHLGPQALVLLNFDKESFKHVDFILPIFAREGVVECSSVQEYLSQSTWLHDGIKNGTVRALSNAPAVFDERLARQTHTQEFLIRYRDSITAAVEVMRELIEIKPSMLWTNYLLHLKALLEQLSSQINHIPQ